MPRPLPSLAALACALASACLPGGLPPVVPSGPALSLEPAPAPRPRAPEGPLRVVFAGPGGETTHEAEISVVFDRPMRALGLGPSDPPPPITLRPAAKGAFHWIGSSALRFDAETRLPAATSFRAEIPAGTRALDGTALAEPFVLAFTTPRPALVASEPGAGAEGVMPDATIALTFNESVSDAEIARAVSIHAGKRADPLPFTVERRGPARFVLALAHRLPVAARIRIRVDASLRAEEGELPAGADREIAFTTVGPPAVRRIACNPHPQDAALCNPEDPRLTVELTAPMPARTLAKAIVIEPPVRSDLKEYENDDPVDEVSFVPEIKPGARLRVRVDPARGGPALADAWGQRLAVAAPVELRFGNRPVDLRFGFLGTYWSGRGRHDFPAVLVNTGAVEVSAAPYPLAQLLAHLASRDTPAAPAPGPKSVSLAAGRLDEEARHTVHLDDLLPAGTRGPVQVISRRAGAVPEGRVVQLTDLAISARVGHGTAAVLVSGLDDGKPVPGAAVEVYRIPRRRKGGGPAVLSGAAPTAADGSVAVPLTAPFGDGDSVALVARTAGEWAFATLSAPAPPRAVGSIYTERGIYRPGETVKLGGVFRVPGPSALETPAGAEVSVEVHGDGAAPVFSTRTTLSAFGTFAVDLPLRADAPLGRYRVTARVGEGRDLTSFRVAEYRPTSIAVEASTSAASYVRGDTFACRAEGRYLHGGAMAGARATVAIERSESWYVVPGHEKFEIRDRSRPTPERELLRSTSVLDARGGTSFSTPLSLPGMGGPEAVSCSVEVTDLDRQALAAGAQAIVHPGEIYAALARPEHHWIYPGETLDLRAVAVTPAGERRAAQVHLEATVRIAMQTKETRLGGCDVTTGPDPVGCSIKVPDPGKAGGEITMRASTRDARGNAVSASYSVRIDERPKPPKPEKAAPPPPSTPPPRRLEVSLERRELHVGDTATLAVESPFAGPSTAFVTVEREGILWQKVVPIPGPSARVPFPVTHGMIPDATAQVTLIAGGQAQRASTSFEVDSAPQKLRVAIDPHGEGHAPGEEIDVDVTVSAAGGAPARAEVTLYAADEGSLSLAHYRLPDPHGELFERRWSLTTGVETRDDRVRLGLWGTHRSKPPSVRMGATKVNFQPTRTDFRQTVVFAPHLVTDAAGRVRRRVKLPDALTSYRFMAVAVAADDRAGAAETNVKTSLPLMARASLPRVIRAGDRFEAAVVVTTSADLPAGDVELQADVTGLVLEGPARRSLRISPGPLEARFRLRAERPGPAKLTVRARSGKAADAMALSTEVVTPIFPESAAVDGETASAAAERLASTAGLRPDYGGLEVTLSSGPLAGLSDGIRQLVEYPYGCTEQTVSSMVPLLALRDLARTLASELPADVSPALDRAVKRVLANQRGDGGFGLWPESAKSQPWVTAWALWGLGEARRRGITVPEAAESRARGHLRAALGVAADGPPADLALAAFLADQAAEDGRPDSALAARLAGARDRLPPFGKALLLHALARARQEPAAQADLARALEAFVRLDGAAAHAVVADPIAASFDTDTRTTAMILRAFVAHAPDHPLVPRLARGLLGMRRDGRFRTTQDAAWALLALDDLRRARPAAPELDARVFLGPTPLGEAHLAGAAARSFQVPMASLLASGGQPLTVAASGGTVHYQARLRFARAGLPSAPEEAGLFVRRAFRPLGPGPHAPGTFVAGELVQVVIDVVAPSPRSFVAIESPLPGGFEAVDADLRTAGRWVRDLTRTGSARRELRDDRVVYFADDLPAGITTYQHVVRASTPGTFVTPPARAEEMYAPDTHGRTAAETIVVAAP